MPTHFDLPLAETVVSGLDMTERPPAQFLLDVEAALDDVDVSPLTILRWGPESDPAFAELPSRSLAPKPSSNGVPDAGLPGPGLTGSAYLPDLGAGLRVTSYHLANQARLDADYCAAMPRAPRGDDFERPPGRCKQTAVAGGDLATIDVVVNTKMTEALFVTGRSVVRVTSWTMDTPAAKRVGDRRPVEVAALSVLARDARLRW